MGCCHIVKSEIELQDIHSWFPEDPELAGLDFAVDQSLHIPFAEVSLESNPVDLVKCRGNADIGIKPAPGQEVTRSIGIGSELAGSAARRALILVFTASGRAGFDGPRFDPDDKAAL